MKVELITGDFKYPDDKTCIFLGGNLYNKSFKEYLEEWTDEAKEQVILIKKYIKKNKLVGKTGEWADNKYFKFDNGEIWSFTWRAWGDLMQAIVNKREGYMAYYM